MKYQSTRGGVTGVSFEETLFQGYAPDGGLYVPETVPGFPEELRSKWKNTSPKYPEVVYEIVKLFVSEEELPRDVLKKCIQEAYATFDTENVIETHECKLKGSSSNYKVVELFHGRTKSFKDYALSLVGKLMDYYVRKNGSHATILVGTSGDTGSAAIEAVRGLKGVDIIVLYPKGMITKVQELQMITVPENNVHVFETEGTSDDLDEPIKASFPADGVTSINSINWARIMIQVAHYVYISALEKFNPVDIYVPTGGAGNISAGLVATLLGFPINLYSTQNVNDNVATFINTGELLMGGKVLETFANAMDIRYPYNVERLLYFLSDAKHVSKIMKETESGVVKIAPEIMENLKTRVKGAMMVDTPKTLETIRECWELNKYLVCPHTATAVTYFSKRQGENGASANKTYVIATASPEKFPDAVKAAQLPDCDFSKYFAEKSQSGKCMMEELISRKVKQPKIMRKGENWYEILQAEIRSIQSNHVQG